MELRNAEPGRFSKKTSCIRLPPWEQYALIFRSVHLQHAKTTNHGDITLAQVHAWIRPQFGWYNIISLTAHGPFQNQSGR